MPLYTQDEIKAEIIALKAKISKAEDEQETTSGGPSGQGRHNRRGSLESMYQRPKYLEAEWGKLEILNTQGNVSLVEFGDPS